MRSCKATLESIYEDAVAEVLRELPRDTAQSSLEALIFALRGTDDGDCAVADSQLTILKAVSAKVCLPIATILPPPPRSPPPPYESFRIAQRQCVQNAVGSD